MKGERILLVDDEEDFVDCLAERMQRRGVDCEAVHTGAEAIARISASPFDLVVLDMLLPDLNGAEVLRFIKAIRPETLVIILTGHASAGEGMKTMRAGAEEYLIKPVELETLLEELHSLLLKKSRADDKDPAGSAGREAWPGAQIP